MQYCVCHRESPQTGGSRWLDMSVFFRGNQEGKTGKRWRVWELAWPVSGEGALPATPSLPSSVDGTASAKHGVYFGLAKVWMFSFFPNCYWILLKLFTKLSFLLKYRVIYWKASFIIECLLSCLVNMQWVYPCNSKDLPPSGGSGPRFLNYYCFLIVLNT